MIVDIVICVLLALGIALHLFNKSRSAYVLDTTVDRMRLKRGVFRKLQTSGFADADHLLDMKQDIPRALWRICEYVMADFIEYWYDSVSANPDFPFALRAVFENLFAVLLNRASKVDWTQFVVKHVVSDLTTLLRLFRKATESLKKEKEGFMELSRIEQSGLVEAKLLREFKFHVAVTGDPAQYLRKVSTAFMSKLLHITDFSCDSGRALLRELMTRFVLVPVMGFCSPYWINLGGVYITNYVSSMQQQHKEKERGAATELLDELMEEVEGKSPPFTPESASSTLASGATDTAAAPEELPEEKLMEHRKKTRSDSFLDHRVKAFSEQKRAREFAPMGDEFVGEEEEVEEGKQPVANPDTAIPSPLSLSALGPSWDVRVECAIMKFDPKPYVSYTILVNTNGYSWTIGKRYTRFTELHASLKKNVADFDARLPKKQWFANFEDAFIQRRREELQRYIDQLTWINAVAQSDTFKEWLLPADLSQVVLAEEGELKLGRRNSDMPSGDSGKNGLDPAKVTRSATVSNSLASTPKKSVRFDIPAISEGMQPSNLSSTLDEVALSKKPETPQRIRSKTKAKPLIKAESMPAQLNRSPALQQSLSPNISDGGLFDFDVSSFLAPAQPERSSTNSGFDPLNAIEEGKRSERRRKERDRALKSIRENARVMEPLHELLHEVFQLGSETWLRTNTMLLANIVIKLGFDAALQSSVSSQVDAFTSEKTMVATIEWITDLIWPDGELFKPGPAATPAEEAATRDEFEALMRSVVAPNMALLGKGFSEAAVSKFFDFCQIDCLIKHLSYSALDALVIELFPELGAELRDAAQNVN